MANTKERRIEGREGKEEEEEETKKEEKTKKEKNNKSEKDSRKMGDLGQKRRSSKFQRRGQEIGSSKALQVDLYLWKEIKWEYVNEKNVWLYNRYEGDICAKKGKGVPTVKKRERKGV